MGESLSVDTSKVASAASAATGVRPLTVLVVDDHPVFADALALALNNCEYLSCVGTAADTDHALSRAQETAPDVVVMDVDLGASDGIAATRQLRERYPRTRVLVLTGQH